jgi:hypothetical protein
MQRRPDPATRGAVFGCPASPEQLPTSPECLPTSNGTAAHIERNTCPHPAESTIVQLRKARSEMMLLDISFTLFLIHVGNLTTAKNDQRRFAPTTAHITEIRTVPAQDAHLARESSCSFNVLLASNCTGDHLLPYTLSPKHVNCSLEERSRETVGITPKPIYC